METPPNRQLLTVGRPHSFICTTLTFQKFCTVATVYLRHVFRMILTKTQIISLIVINSLIFITDTKCAFCELGLQLCAQIFRNDKKQTHFAGKTHDVIVTTFPLVDQVTLKMETPHFSVRLVIFTSLSNHTATSMGAGRGCNPGMWPPGF